MRSARSMLVALSVALSPTAQAETWPDSLHTDADRACVASRICRGSPLGSSRCLSRYDEMVSEKLANPYRQAEPASGEDLCLGEDPDPCVSREAIAIGRLIAIYESLSESRAVFEMRTGKPARRRTRLRWERLAWCRQHYEPALGPSSYEDVLHCYSPGATRDLRDPDARPYRVVGGSQLFVGNRDCPGLRMRPAAERRVRRAEPAAVQSEAEARE
jgi:hypothetical protein